MLVRFGLDGPPPEWDSSVVCIGTFDGVHLGHQEVIRHAVARANAHNLPSVVVTFDRHPAATLAPERCPPSIGTLSTNLAAFAGLGVSAVAVLPFDLELAHTEAEDFYRTILQGALKAKEAAVGHDFAFGRNRVGTAEWLAERIPTEIIPPLMVGERRVSSSEIRQAIAAGNVGLARDLLGRPWVQEGVVVRGQRLGRTLGFPTANLAGFGGQAVPADGVYAGRAETPFGNYRAAVGVGRRPTVGGGPRTIEAYLIDYPGESLYGAPLRLEYRARLRDDQTFDSLEGLKAQMSEDVAQARNVE